MSHYNWFHNYFKEKHKLSSTEEKLDDLFMLLESRGLEYLDHNKEVYKELYINPLDDIVNSKPQIIQQVKQELYDFLKLLLDTDVKSVLQVGLGHFGSTQFCLGLLFDKVVTVEYDIRNIANYTNRELLYNQNRETFIYGDSTSKDVLDKVEKFGKFDCVFIDGNHSYEYVKLDYENYLPFLKDGGLFAFHDALLEAERYGTPRVLKDIEDRHNIHIIEHSNEVGIAYFEK